MCGAFVYIYSGGISHRAVGSVVGASIGELIAQNPHMGSRYNIRPSQAIVTVVSTVDGPLATAMRWGLIPSWSQSEVLPVHTFNARDDRLHESRMWRNPFKRSRGIVPASGFFEWDRVTGSKQPMYITHKDNQEFNFAAICDQWVNGHGEIVESCAIITTGANEFMSAIHHRMPVILSEENATLWLDNSIKETDSLRAVLKHSPNGSLKAHPVSIRVNSHKNDDPGLVDEVSFAGHGPGSDFRQLDLFGDLPPSPTGA